MGCATSDHPRASGKATPQRLGNHSFKITTTSREAQRSFDRGLTWTYSFAHHAAEQEFRRAAAADPNCAMAYWGIALVNGPHINFPLVPPDRAAKAWNAINQARELAPGASRIEQALINALARRYAYPQPEERSALDHAYAQAMGEVWRAFPKNDDVGALYAEAEMDLHPWNLWKDHQPQPWTPHIVATLERVLELNPLHPAANHYYIHAVEASPHPEKALACADRLAKLTPDASHMVHMPAHIYARVGDWKKAAEANRDAMRADKLYRTIYPRPGFYAMYMAHNNHFLAFTAMMQGRSEEAVALAREMIASMPTEFISEYPAVADGFTVFPAKVLMRFGKWEQVLAEPPPAGGLPLATALWHFTRATALTVLDRLDEARSERETFAQAAAKVPESATFGNNSAHDLLAIAKLVLEGEMLAQEGKFEPGAAKLREAVRLEDKLHYDEPPDWIQPVRHTLGAVLLSAGQGDEAEQVYREDLRVWPENGWSYLGLRQALLEQGKRDEALVADAKLKRVWAGADISPTTTCFCQERKRAQNTLAPTRSRSNGHALQ